MSLCRVLVTGASGFVGACLTENLVSEGREVHVILRGGADKWRLKKLSDDIRLWDIDIRDAEGINKTVSAIKPEYIYHLAAYGAYPHQKETEKIISTNINGTVNLLDACLKLDFASFINIGSSSEYGLKDKPMNETDVLEPIDVYGVSKAFASQYCSMIGRSMKRPVSTVRLFSPYGFYEEKTRLVPTVIMSCFKGENPKLASKTAVRDFVFIEDIIDLIKKVGASAKEGCIYNGGMGKQHTVMQMVNLIIEETGAGVVPDWGKAAGRLSDSTNWEADMEFVKRELGWEPRYSLRDGIKKTIRWFRDNMELYG